MAEPKKRKMENASSSKDRGHGKFQADWIKLYPGVVEASKVGATHVFCKICCKDVKVTASGLYDLKEHFKTKLHENNFKIKSTIPSITSFRINDQGKQNDGNVTSAEVVFANFDAQHNLAPSVSDHFCEVIAKMFPDSSIAQKFSSRRTKTTLLVNNCLAKSATERVIKLCKETPFSLMIDESNDKKTDKRLAIMVRVFEDGVGPKTRLLDMPVCSGGTSEAIFTDVDTVFTNLSIPWSNCIGFASDNCSVMVGKSNSVLTRIKQKNPVVFSIGCICHMANLCAQDGVKQLTVPVDDLLVDIYYHFEHSFKRRRTYKDFQLFTEVDDLNILKHCQTRWLSLQKVVDKILNQYSALSSYFESNEDVEKPGRVSNIFILLKLPLTQLTLQFLQFVLPLLNEFNRLFQSDESQIGGLMDEMDRLLRKFLVKFVQMKFVKQETDLRMVKFCDPAVQHDDSMLAIGLANRTFMTKMETDEAVKKSFFGDVRNFYAAVVKRMVGKFPFDNQVLKDLKVLDPSLRNSLQYTHICRLAATFCPHLDPEILKDEFDDYCLMSDEHVSVIAPSGQKRSFCSYWLDIINQKTSIGALRFPTLKIIIQRLLTLPHSNADCERSFSMMKNIHTDCRKSMNADTLTSFLQCKINTDSCCSDFRPTEAILTLAKSVCTRYNEEHSAK